jgi:hypothetical protein
LHIVFPSFPQNKRDGIIHCRSISIALQDHDKVYQRRDFLATKRARDLFVCELKRVRREYGFRLVGDVLMPNHVHLLMGEPLKRTVSTVLQMLKQRGREQLVELCPGDGSD